MKKTLICISVMSLSLFSCQKKSGIVLENQSLNINTQSIASKSFAKKLVLEDNYLDVNLAHMKGNDDTAKARAAVYRFYKHVHLQNGFYVTDLANERKIKISSSSYAFLLGNLNHMNDLKRLHEKKGDVVSLPEIDSAYLKSLIQ